MSSFTSVPKKGKVPIKSVKMGTKPGLKKKKEGGGDAAYDQEQQFIMRLPQETAAALRQEIAAGGLHLKERLSIELQHDLRKGAIRYGNDFFYAKMVDLPCLIESLKTVDMKTFYKTADLSQMLITVPEDDNTQDENDSPKKKDKDKKHLWNHGITPPLKNVRKRRFRKTLKKKYMDQPDIEKEVKRLFRTDSEAISVKWELITEDEKQSAEGGLAGSSLMGTSGGFSRTDTAASLDIDIFGELSTSEDEDDKDVNIVDSEDDVKRQQSYISLDSLGSQPSLMDTPSQLDSTSQQQAVYLSMNSLALQQESETAMHELGRHLEDITRNMKDDEDSQDVP